MKFICFYFQIHQPFRFRNYSFFDIGKNHYYYNDFLNESVLQKVASKSYLPTNKILLKLIEEYGNKFKVTFSISGTALDQFELYAPEVIDSFKQLAKTGNVEFLAETSSHSLASQFDLSIFRYQIENHVHRIENLFGYTPKVFRNTELIYSDQIGAEVYKMGFKGMLTEGAKHILGWKSPNFVYYNALQPKMKLLLKNFKLSDDIAFRFSNKKWDQYPLTAEKFAYWLQELNPKEEVINLFMDYETFGEHQWEETGIFEFLKALPKTILKQKGFSFETPSLILKKLQPMAVLNVPHAISWADEERDLTAWLGNSLQQEAFNKLYALTPKIKQITDTQILQDWEYLQTSDHFYYMSTKWFTDGEVHSYFNPFKDPYEAFINYMNILTDFTSRVNYLVPDITDNKEINRLNNVVIDKMNEIEKLKAQLKRVKKQMNRV